jgi:RsiW-degrading membrane proteinase PrsW (M82 family)
MAIRPGGAMVQSAIPTRSQLIPILSNWKQLSDKSQLGAMVITVIAILLMYAYIDDKSVIMFQRGADPQHWVFTSKFLILVGSYLTLLSLYFIYRLAGKKKSWLVLLGCFAFTSIYLWMEMMYGSFAFVYEFFHITLAGGEPDPNLSFPELFFRHFVGTGFFEEFVKAIPLLVLLYFTPRMAESTRSTFGIEEPLDGVLMGAASAGGFALMETLLQYVSGDLVHTWIRVGLQANGVDVSHGVGHIANFKLAAAAIQAGLNLVGAAPGAQLLIPRSLDETFGHMAYSGYLGYFIGLSVLRPQRRWLTLGIGYASASLCHALWDSVDSTFMEVVIGLLSYAVLAAAILKAREISPKRMLLQPSVVFGAVTPTPVNPDAAAVPNAPAAPVNQPPVNQPAPQQFTPGGPPQLRIGTRVLIIVPGLRILEHQAPGLRAQTAGGAVAEVTRNPQDPSVLGLTNLSSTSWEIVTAKGNRHQIPSGQTVKLSAGTKIDFGVLDGEIR